MVPSGGFPIVLTADRTLMARYDLLFDGMLAATMTTTTPAPIMYSLIMPRQRSVGGVAFNAPLGLRRIEAALRAGGYTGDDVAIVEESHLRNAIGPATRIIGITSGEPLGGGMNSTTMTAVAGGSIYPERMFQRLLKNVKRHKAEAAPGAKLILGGPGAWQAASDEAGRHRLGIDHVLTGYCEANVAEVFHRVIVGEALPEVIVGKPPSATDIPRILGPTTMGVVEMSRGCGLGCDFCTISRTPMMHVPPDTILADIETNVRAGVRNISVLSEDFFRYGGAGLKVNPEALFGVLRSAREIPGLRLLQLDHTNIISVEGYNDDELAEAHRLLVGENHHEYLWVNLGVETASGALLAANGGSAKMGRHAPVEWGDVCTTQIRRLCAAGYFPLISLVIGMPGETPEDLERTITWIEGLKDDRVSIFPLLYAPVDGSDPVGARETTPLHWRLLRRAYDFNFRWMTYMYQDNMAAGGVPAWKRTLIQGMAYGQIAEWKTFFCWHSWQARRRSGGNA